MVLRQGSGKNENQWAHKRAAFPKACAPAFGLALQTAIVAGVNFDRELMYDSQWAFFPHFNNAHHCDTVIGHHTITIC